MKRSLVYLCVGFAMAIGAAAALGAEISPALEAATEPKATKAGTKEDLSRKAPRAAKKSKPAPVKVEKDVVPDKAPLAYGRDLVRVTGEGTLSVRYRAWNDFWGGNLASYLGDAKKAAAARGTPPKHVTFAGVFMKNVEIVCPNHMGGDGLPLRGTFTISDAQQNAMREEARKVTEFFFAASEGRLVVDFIFPVVDGLKVESPNQPIFSVWPRGLQDQLLPALKQYEDANVAMWVFLCPRPVTLNPLPNGKGIGVGPFGICYTAWPLYGGYCMTTTAPAAGLWVHEFNHRYLDGLKNHEGIALTKIHSLGQLGYAPGMNLDEGYFNAYRHLIRSAIFDRFSIGAPNQTPFEPFGGKAYAWSDVQDDCWFKIPELHNAELAKLTGIESIEIDTNYGGSARLFRVAAAERAKVLSTYIEPPLPLKRGETPPDGAAAAPTVIPVQLDNYLRTGQESCAVLKTATGQWLFVSVNMADLYCDMLKISGRGDQPLELYGYVNEGVLPLLVFKAPAEMPLPSCEEGYFRQVQ